MVLGYSLDSRDRADPPSTVSSISYASTKNQVFHNANEKALCRDAPHTPRPSVALREGGLCRGGFCQIDGTLPSTEGFQIKYRAAQKRGKSVSVHAVIPDDLRRAFVGFLERERKYDEKHFYRTHSSSRATLLWIAKEYPKVPITVAMSYFKENGNMKFRELSYGRRRNLIAYIESIQYNEKEIKKFVS